MNGALQSVGAIEHLVGLYRRRIAAGGSSSSCRRPATLSLCDIYSNIYLGKKWFPTGKNVFLFLRDMYVGSGEVCPVCPCESCACHWLVCFGIPRDLYI